MFDAICVSQQTRKPWTVTVSFAAQGALIGLAVLAPLMSTEGLPHLRLVSNLLPAPPLGPTRRAQTAVKPVKPVPFELTRGVLSLPPRIPEKAALIQDEPDFELPPGSIVGLPGGAGNPAGPGNAVIEGLARTMPVPEAPALAVARPSAPAAPIRIRVGGSVQEGKFLSGPRPVYPALAKAARISGTVRLQAVISRDGAIIDLRVVSGHPLLVPGAMSAVKQWLFQPTYLNGEPVEVATDIEVNFTLRN